MTNPTITILMATYNGSKFFAAQIDSIIAQSYTNWELLIRDDGSSDDTVNLILAAVKNDDRIKIITNPSKQPGACANFSSLLSWAKANRELDYIMFCDQDDIWLPGKITYSLHQLQQTEMANQGKPCLVYGHLNMMDENGEPMKEIISMLAPPHFNNIIVQNPMFGCTMMFNKALAQLLPEIPPNAENHDYWVALVAVALGVYTIIPEDIILYRQHTNNVTSQGAGLLKRFNRYYNNEKQIKELAKKLVMLCNFFEMYHLQLRAKDKNLLNDFLSSFKSPLPGTLISVLITHKICKVTKSQTMAMLYVMIKNYFIVRKAILNINFLK